MKKSKKFLAVTILSVLMLGLVPMMSGCGGTGNLEINVLWEDPSNRGTYVRCSQAGVAWMNVEVYDPELHQMTYPGGVEDCSGLLPGITGWGEYRVSVIGGLVSDQRPCWSQANVTVDIRSGQTAVVTIEVPLDNGQACF